MGEKQYRPFQLSFNASLKIHIDRGLRTTTPPCVGEDGARGKVRLAGPSDICLP
jgi:hypothetical protein